MKRLLWLLLAATAPLAAQITDLVTTDDGGVLYFSSPLRLQATEQFAHEKIFRLADGVFQLVAQVEREQLNDSLSNFFRLRIPDVSGDGSVVSYVGGRDCIGGSRCAFVAFHLSTVESPDLDQPLVLAGSVQLSRNGRYAVQASADGANVALTNRIDLVTGEQIALPRGLVSVAARRQAITSDGQIMLATMNGPALWTPEEMTVLPIQGDHLASARINDQGGWVIYESFLPRELHSIELESGTDTLLAESSVDFFRPSVSNDGSLVLYVAPVSSSSGKGVATMVPQAFLTNSDGTGRLQLTDAPEGLTESVLSGDGTVVYAATPIGRLLRINVATGATEELIRRSPTITAIEGGAAPGSLSFMHGTGLSETVAVADTPLPESLDGVTVRLGNIATRMLLVAPNDVRFQIPFDIEPGDFQVRISSPKSPFEQAPVVLTVSPLMPRFIKNGVEVVIPGARDRGDVIVNLDFSKLITEDNNAKPADIVTLYMTGLGVTEPAVATGELTPLGPLLLPNTPIECSWFAAGGEAPIETFFAGLAPGLIGVYQVTVRLPADPPPSVIDPSRTLVSIRCGAPDGPTDIAGVPVRLDQ